MPGFGKLGGGAPALDPANMPSLEWHPDGSQPVTLIAESAGLRVAHPSFPDFAFSRFYNWGGWDAHVANGSGVNDFFTLREVDDALARVRFSGELLQFTNGEDSSQNVSVYRNGGDLELESGGLGKVKAAGSELEVVSRSGGQSKLVLHSPDGSRHELTVDDAGVLDIS